MLIMIQVKAWLLTATALTALFAIDHWLGSTPLARLAVIGAAATAAAMGITHFSAAPRERACPVVPIAEPRRTPPQPPSDLALAIEHIQSIRVLLQISALHNQPVPRAVLVNLDLVLKHLRRLNGASPIPTEIEQFGAPPHRTSGVVAEM